MAESSRGNMLKGLTRDNLHGVWAAVATPFDDCDRFDEGVLRENVRRLAAAGVHGIYTTDSDGEFYAVEFDEFRRIVGAFADEAQQLGVPTQAGVTWCNTQGTVERLQFTAECGILGAHVGHPMFMPMGTESHRAFWADVSRAVPSTFALVHYNTPRCPNYLYGPDYARLATEIPNLVGTKHVGTSFTEFLSLIKYAPDLSHFAGEHSLTPYMMFGAKGVYSWLANFNAAYAVAWYDDCVKGRWDSARKRQERVHAFGLLKREVFGSENYHGIVNKAMAAASPFLVSCRHTRRPYLPIPDEAIELFRRRAMEEFPDLLWAP
ncbi:MAG: dihydrodipicolinate synthase family protein [Chloroflexota bacterium]